MFKEFREFAMKGNVIDMAVGLIIGAGFGKIVSSLVTDVIMPPLGLLLARVDFRQLAWTMKDATATAPAVQLRYGLFIQSVLDFVIIAFVVFLMIRAINRLKRQSPPPEPNEKECPFCVKLVPLKATKCAFCTSELAKA